MPSKALERYDVVLDYPGRKFTIAVPDCVIRRGVAVSSPFVAGSGHPRILVSIAHYEYAMLLDTGSTATLMRGDVLASLAAEHPSWPHATGASGVADMPPATGAEFMLRAPELQWGPFRVRNVLLVSRPDATYSMTDYETAGPISGALGSNVLKNFRVEIDYPAAITYLEQKVDDAGADMKSVGLVLDVSERGRLVVVGVSSSAAAATKANVERGDQILQIDGRRESDWTLHEAADALSGPIGEMKKLLVIRDGHERFISVVVAHLL